METIWQDLSYAARRLAKSPAFTFVAVLSLAIGIGANSAIFSVTNALLLRPLPYKDADRLVILWNRSPGLNIVQDWFSLGQYLDIKIENRVFQEVAATIGASFNLTGQAIPERIEGARVSSSLFPVLGVEAAIGRVFVSEDEEKGRQPIVILSHGFWQRRFGADQDVIGQTLILNDKSVTIVGVMPAGFSLNREMMPTVDAIQKADILLPLAVSDADRSNRGGEDYNIFARLKPGVTVAQAQSEMDSLAEQMKQQYPESYPSDGGLTLSVVPLLDQVVGDVRLALYVLLGAVGFVLLIACANVANLSLSRAAVRQKEIAIRAAVGASRLRILRQLLTESHLLAVMGGIAGLASAFLALKLLRVFAPQNIPRLSDVGVDWRVLAFTFLVSLLTGLIFGIVPALKASRVDLNEVLKEGGRSASGAAGVSQHRIRRLLIVGEVALSLILLIGAGLLVRSYQHVQNANPGFNTRDVVSLRLSVPAARYPNAAAVTDFYQRLGERVRALPGVEAAATTYLLPLSSNAYGWGPIAIDGYVPKIPQELIISNLGMVSPDYFRVLSIPLVKGRHFDERDKKGAQEVCIVDENLANRFWPDEDPIGKRVQRSNGTPWRTVVGVVRYEKEVTLEEEPPIRVYFPIDQNPAGTRYLIARADSDSAQLTASITEVIRDLDPELPVYDVYSMDQRLHDSLARRRFSAFLLGLFAVFALVLAAIGIYGVISYWVNQRTHEIGIRMALGAGQGKILHLVLKQALVMVSIGIGLGLAGAALLTRVISSLLFGIGATDGLTFLTISLLLGFIALMASYFPARRATKVDPIVALRYE
jgi:predicted permease